MPIIADGAVKVGADLAPFHRDMRSGLAKGERDTESSAQRMKGSISGIAAGLGVAFGAAQVVSFFGDAIQAAGEFEDSVSATGVIFGEEAIPALQEWADEAHSAFGASKQDALEAANQFAIFGKSAGLVGDDLTDFSTKLVQLGGDLASFYGGRTEDAIAAVGSALRGEFEPIRAYGVLLDDATLRQEAFEMGLISTTQNALTPQQKVLAAQAAIFEQTTDAQGDFARTSDGLMNTQRDLAAELENVSIEVGEEMLPIMLELVTFLKDEGIPIMREFIGLLNFEDVKSAEGIPVLQEIEDFLNNADFGAMGEGEKEVHEFGEAINELNDLVSGGVLGDMWRFDPDIEVAARRLGVTYGEMADRVEEAITRTGDTQYRVLQSMTGDLEGLEVTVDRTTGETTAAWRNHARDVADATDRMSRDQQENQDEAVEIARQTPGALANALRAGIEDYDEALTELADVAANSVSDLAERQKIEGILASQQLTDALNSDSTRTRLLALDLVDDLVADYELLAPGALRAGALVNPDLARGMQSNLGLVENAANAIVDAAGNPLLEMDVSAGGASLINSWINGMDAAWATGVNRVYAITNRAGRILGLSLPTEGPLAGGIASGGYSIIESWFSEMDKAAREGMGTLTGIAGAAGLALNPAASGMGSMPLGSVAGVAGAGITYELHVNGVPRAFNSRTDFMNALDDLGSFGDGRL